jgi:hypothetical protein
MKTKLSAAFTILLISLLSLLNHSAKACYSEEEQSTFIFGPGLFSDTLYSMYFYRAPQCGNCEATLYKTNLLEWQKNFPEVKNLADIERIIYKSSLEELQQMMNGNNPYGKNDFALSLLANVQYIKYLLLAKQCEKFAAISTDEEFWEGRSESDKAEIATMLPALLSAIGDPNDAFLKQRYAFQLIRTAHYAGQYQDCLNYYDQYVTSDMPKNSIYYRTLALKAGALRKTGNSIQAKYLFALIFDKSPELRYLAYQNYKFIDVDEAQWNQCLAMAQSNSEKSGIWLIKNIYDDMVDITVLKNLYENDPGSSRLEVAVLKQLNNIEISIYMPFVMNTAALDSTALTYGTEDTWEATGVVAEESGSWFSRLWNSIVDFFRRLFGIKKETTSGGKIASNGIKVLYADIESQEPASSPKESTNIQELKELIGKITEDKAVSNRALFLLVKAYLEIMTEDYADAQESVKKVYSINTGTNSKITRQADYLSLLAAVEASTEISTETENKVLSYLSSNGQDAFDVYRRNFLLDELGRKYIRNQQYNKAILVFRNSSHNDVAGSLIDIFFNNDDIEKLKVYAASPLPDFEKYLIKDFYNENQLLEIQATKLARIGRFKEANDVFAKIPETYWKTSNTYKGYSYYSDNDFDCGNFTSSYVDAADKSVAEKATYNKKDFVKKVLELQSTENAENTMQLGNIFYYTHLWAYNAPIWKCQDLLDALRYVNPGVYPLNINGFSTAYHNRKKSFVVQSCTQYFSEKYYAKTAELAKDDELKARALFCAKKAAEKFYIDYYFYQKNNYFDRLTKDFSNTNYYKEASKSCSYLRDFQPVQ